MKHRLILSLVVALLVCVIIGVSPAYAKQGDSGTCGENVRWVFSEETNTLTISGDGEIECEALMHSMPWSNRYEEIYHVVIKDGVTAICDYAFEGGTQIQDVTIPESVTSIGDHAFERTGIRHIALHDGITHIGLSAFEWSSLEEVTVPKGITELECGVFRQCNNLQNVVLQEGITLIGTDAFKDCICLKSIVIPNTVTQLNPAFWGCEALESVTMGEAVTSIGVSCFQFCSSLQEIRIPDGVKAIEASVFENCTSLKSVEIGAGVEEINTTAFRGCTALKEFVVSPSNPYLCNDTFGVIFSKDLTTMMLMPTGYEGTYSVPEGTQMIGREAGYELLSLTGLIIPDSVTEIYFKAFTNCSALNHLELGNSITLIYAEAFERCTSLESVLLPASLTYLENSAFGFCTGLKSIEFTGSFPYFEDFVFANVDADAFYPMGDETWNADLSVINGALRWKAKCAGAHTFVKSEAVPSSCVEPGKSEYMYCSVCGFIKDYPQQIPPTGHKFGPWKYITPPGTPEIDRIVEQECEICGVKNSVYAKSLDASDLPVAPPDPDVSVKPLSPREMLLIAIIVLAIGTVCYVGVEIYLMRRKKAK